MQSYGANAYHQQGHSEVNRDPLIAAGNYAIAKDKVEREDKAEQGGPKGKVYATLMAIVPFVFFCVMLVTTFMAYHKSLPGTFLTFALALVFSFLITLMGSDRKFHYIGVLCSLATLFGLCVGLSVYYSTMIYYYSYFDMGKYTNVAASQSPAEFLDAGMLLFTSDTRLDLTRAVGYRSVKEGRTMCVAPVVDNADPQAPVNFFAVGINCCEERQSFNCDSAQDSQARSGLLMLQPDMLVSDSMEWAVNPDGLDAFKEAIRLSQTTADADKVRFLRWVRDPVDETDQFWYQGFHKCGLSCLWYLIVNTVAAIYLGVYKKPRKPTI